jgi:hypothetical protein
VKTHEASNDTDYRQFGRLDLPMKYINLLRFSSDCVFAARTVVRVGAFKRPFSLFAANDNQLAVPIFETSFPQCRV